VKINNVYSEKTMAMFVWKSRYDRRGYSIIDYSTVAFLGLLSRFL